ncbi:MAG: hypothetical protein PHQ12_02140 [Chthoniobacteraceae bacterium]|nr:hypothetical protein [Chthoniobacteraceae bacterium]
MNIQSVRPEIVVEAAKSKPKSKSVDNETQNADGVRDSYMPEQNDNLMQALRNQPDVRPEMLERAKQLAADPGYPPKDVIDAIANILVPATRK